MEFTTTGTVQAIGPVRTTKQNVKIVQLEFKADGGRVFYPSLSGKMAPLVADISEGDKLELACTIAGSKNDRGTYNNVFIDSFEKL